MQSHFIIIIINIFFNYYMRSREVEAGVDVDVVAFWCNMYAKCHLGQELISRLICDVNATLTQFLN